MPIEIRSINLNKGSPKPTKNNFLFRKCLFDLRSELSQTSSSTAWQTWYAPCSLCSSSARQGNPTARLNYIRTVPESDRLHLPRPGVRIGNTALKRVRQKKLSARKRTKKSSLTSKNDSLRPVDSELLKHLFRADRSYFPTSKRFLSSHKSTPLLTSPPECISISGSSKPFLILAFEEPAGRS